MTDEAMLERLAARCEAASGADREIDFDILCLVDPRAVRSGPLHGDPRYTASLDAAMTLAGSEAVSVLLDAINDCQEEEVSEWVKALPRFICAAALRAQSAEGRMM